MIHLFLLRAIVDGTEYYEDLRGIFATLTIGEDGVIIQPFDHSAKLFFGSVTYGDKSYITRITTPNGQEIDYTYQAVEYNYQTHHQLASITSKITSGSRPITCQTVALTYDNTNGELASVFLDQWHVDENQNPVAPNGSPDSDEQYYCLYDYTNTTSNNGIGSLT